MSDGRASLRELRRAFADDVDVTVHGGERGLYVIGHTAAGSERAHERLNDEGYAWEHAESHSDVPNHILARDGDVIDGNPRAFVIGRAEVTN